MEEFSGWAAVVLAAGKGTRMRSAKPKVLHTLLGEPMLAYVLRAISPLFSPAVYIVDGHMADEVEEMFAGQHFIRQPEQLGTAHAVLTTLPLLEDKGFSRIFIANGDAPLITTRNIIEFMNRAAGADIAFATLMLADPAGYGRVVRKEDQVSAIVEAKDFDPAIHGRPSGEVNAGVYAISMEAARKLLPLVHSGNKSGEYYLTDIIGAGIKAGMDVRGIPCGSDFSFLGVNSPTELAAAENILAGRVAEQLMKEGVILHAPQLARISPIAQIEPGCEIFAPCEIYGHSNLGSGTRIRAYCILNNCQTGQNALINSFCHLENARIASNAVVGPFARLRPGAILEDGSHVGNFVELKNTRLGKGAKANHLTYLGDSLIGENVNIGAGTITCNYDGKNKHKTVIGEDAFIGSNSALVAPVEIGARALVGAGSVVTKNVPDDNMAIGRARQQNLPGRGAR